MADRGEAAPGNDFFDIAWLVKDLLDLSIAALPVGHAQMLRQRVIRRHIHHRARDRRGRQWIVRWCLDDRVAARQGIARNRQRRDPRVIARDNMHSPRAKRPDGNARPGGDGPFDPVFQILDTHGALHHLAQVVTVEQPAKGPIDVAQLLDRQPGGAARQLESFIHIRIAVERQACAQIGEIVQQLVKTQSVQVLQ